MADCKKKWRHLRSSLSRYLKSSKDAKNKNQRLKPYYLLNQMEFLIPYTKSLDTMTYKSELPPKFEAESEAENEDNIDQDNGQGTSQISYTTLKPEQQDHSISYTAESVVEDDDENPDSIVYETYEISSQQKTNVSRFYRFCIFIQCSIKLCSLNYHCFCFDFFFIASNTTTSATNTNNNKTVQYSS